MKAIHFKNPLTIMPFGQYAGTYLYIVYTIDGEYIEELMRKGFITIDSTAYIKMKMGMDIDEIGRLLKRARPINILYEKELRKDDKVQTHD